MAPRSEDEGKGTPQGIGQILVAVGVFLSAGAGTFGAVRSTYPSAPAPAPDAVQRAEFEGALRRIEGLESKSQMDHDTITKMTGDVGSIKDNVEKMNVKLDKINDQLRSPRREGR